MIKEFIKDWWPIGVGILLLIILTRPIRYIWEPPSKCEIITPNGEVIKGDCQFKDCLARNNDPVWCRDLVK